MDGTSSVCFARFAFFVVKLLAKKTRSWNLVTQSAQRKITAQSGALILTSVIAPDLCGYLVFIPYFFGSLALMNLTTLSRYSFGM